MERGGKVSFELKDNTEAVKAALHDAVARALERCGSQAEGYAKDLAPSPGKTGTGRLKADISHKVVMDEKSVYIGTNVKYAIYLEMGTGKYYSGGRQIPWAYQDMFGNWHRTEGQEAKPFLKPAVADHVQTYRNIIKDELKK
jgi:HK97 gp10 family phage protein